RLPLPARRQRLLDALAVATEYRRPLGVELRLDGLEALLPNALLTHPASLRTPDPARPACRSDERLQRPVGCTDVQRMARRQAGAWARRRMRLRRRELIRKHWRPLVRGLGIVLLVATVGITAAAVLFGSWMAWLVVGAVYATL